MSLNVCRYSQCKLPDDTTCGGYCPEFPRCLPPPSPELLAEIARSAQGQEDSEALVARLKIVTAAIERGLGDHPA